MKFSAQSVSGGDGGMWAARALRAGPGEGHALMGCTFKWSGASVSGLRCVPWGGWGLGWGVWVAECALCHAQRAFFWARRALWSAMHEAYPRLGGTSGQVCTWRVAGRSRACNCEVFGAIPVGRRWGMWAARALRAGPGEGHALMGCILKWSGASVSGLCCVPWGGWGLGWGVWVAECALCHAQRAFFGHGARTMGRHA